MAAQAFVLTGISILTSRPTDSVHPPPSVYKLNRLRQLSQISGVTSTGYTRPSSTEASLSTHSIRVEIQKEGGVQRTKGTRKVHEKQTVAN